MTEILNVYVSSPILEYPITHLGVIICKYASLEPSSILHTGPHHSRAYMFSLFVQHEKQALFSNRKIKNKKGGMR